MHLTSKQQTIVTVYVDRCLGSLGLGLGSVGKDSTVLPLRGESAAAGVRPRLYSRRWHSRGLQAAGLAAPRGGGTYSRPPTHSTFWRCTTALHLHEHSVASRALPHNRTYRAGLRAALVAYASRARRRLGTRREALHTGPVHHGPRTGRAPGMHAAPRLEYLAGALTIAFKLYLTLRRHAGHAN